MKHQQVIFLFVLILSAYQQIIADGAHEGMVEQHELNNLKMCAFYQRIYAIRRLYHFCSVSDVFMYFWHSK